MQTLKLVIISLISISLVLGPISITYADTPRKDKAERVKNKKDRKERKAKVKRHKRVKNKRIVVVPRKRSFRNVVVIRHHGHAYHGYGHHLDDNNAWKWLAFTAITLKILDNINEQAQREHEAAQVKATTAPIGENITWSNGDAKGVVVATKEGTNEQGNTCREFQQSITVGGKTEKAFGTACLQADGSWKIIS